MAHMKLNIKKGEETVLLPKSFFGVLADADSTDLRVLLCAAFAESEGEQIDEEKIADALSLSASEVKSAIKFWCGAGVIKKSAQKAKKDDGAKDAQKENPKKAECKCKALPEKRTAFFTSGELCEIAEENKEFKILLDAAQQTAGWIFNTSEIEIIAALYANMRLSGEYILALIGYYVCRKEKPLRYLEKVAYSFIDEGVDTADALEEKLRALEKYDGYEGMVRRLFGLGTRSLIEKERKMISAWMDEYKYGEDIVKKAFEITVSNTGKASLSYANTILKNWSEEGVKKPGDIGKQAKSPKAMPKTTKQGTATARSFDIDDALTKALERSYKGGNK